MSRRKADFLDVMIACGLSKAAANALYLYFVTDRGPEAGEDYERGRIEEILQFSFDSYDGDDVGEGTFRLFLRPGKLRGLTNLAKDSEAATSWFTAHYNRRLKAGAGDANSRLEAVRRASSGAMFAEWLLDLDQRDTDGQLVTDEDRQAMRELEDVGRERLKGAIAAFHRRLEKIRRHAQALDERAQAARALADEYQPEAFSASPHAMRRGGAWHAKNTGRGGR